MHQVSSVCIVIYHVESRAPALCLFYFPPPIHCILDVTLQICSSGSTLGCLSEGAKQTVVGLYVINCTYEVVVFLLDDN